MTDFQGYYVLPIIEITHKIHYSNHSYNHQNKPAALL